MLSCFSILHSFMQFSQSCGSSSLFARPLVETACFPLLPRPGAALANVKRVRITAAFIVKLVVIYSEEKKRKLEKKESTVY